MISRVWLWILIACGTAGSALAHTVPTLTVEAEFSGARQLTLRVNLDPRLFLSPQPGSLPPVPASWWLDQDEAARAGTTKSAIGCLDSLLRFQVGDAPVAGAWKVSAIDSASAFPLGTSSAEVHLLAERQGPLPAVPGDFKVTLSQNAAVGLVLLNSTEGKSERHPQAIFPGETSRAYPVPPLAVPATLAANVPTARSRLGFPDLVQCCAGVLRGRGHLTLDHAAVSLILCLVVGGRFLQGVAILAAFALAQAGASAAVASDWMPGAPWWMVAMGWIALLAGLWTARGGRGAEAAGCFAIAGLAHGFDLPHLHLGGTAVGAAWLAAVQVFALQLMGLAAMTLVLRVASGARRHRRAA